MSVLGLSFYTPKGEKIIWKQNFRLQLIRLNISSAILSTLDH